MENNNTRLATHLNEIMHSSVSIDEQKRKHCIQTVKEVLVEQLLPKMFEEDSLFTELAHKNMHWTGSMYDGLRVKNATEFDVNIILKVPFQLNLQLLDTSPGFARIQLSDEISPTLSNDVVCRILAKLFEDGFLMPGKVRDWFRSVVDRSLQKLKIPGLRGPYSTSGPAITIHVESDLGMQIDVDLVPVCEFPAEQWPQSVRQDQAKYKDKFFAVPKTENFLPENDRPYLWRLGFSQSERLFLHKKECIKKIIRLIKCLRDHCDQPLSALCSYHIKVAVMHMLEEDGRYEEKFIGNLFKKALTKLQDCALSANLPNFWCSTHNLFLDKKMQMGYIGRRLKNIIQKIEANPNNVNLFYHACEPKNLPEILPVEAQEVQQLKTDSKSNSWLPAIGALCILGAIGVAVSFRRRKK